MMQLTKLQPGIHRGPRDLVPIPKCGDQEKSHQLRWNLTGGPFKRKMVLQDPVVRFHVKQWEGNSHSRGAQKQRQSLVA